MREIVWITILSVVFFLVVVWWALSGAPGCIPDGMMLPVCSRPDLGVLSVLGVLSLVLGVYLWTRDSKEEGGEKKNG